jgi:hypothetical protein
MYSAVCVVRVFACVATASGRTAPVSPTVAGVAERVYYFVVSNMSVPWCVGAGARPCESSRVLAI